MSTNIKIYNKLIINKSNVDIPKKHKIIKCRVVGDENFTKFMKLLGRDEKTLRKKEDGSGPYNENERMNIINYEGPEFEYIQAKWYIVDLVFGCSKDKQFFNESMKEYPQMFMGDKTKSLWFPERPILKKNNDVWISDTKISNKYPIYIISKGRYKRQITRNYLEEMKANYKIVVETDEVQLYIDNGCPKERILEFTKEKKNKWTTGDFKEDGGSIPVRNFIWAHSKYIGATHHWCLDDNLDGFFRLHKNARIPIKTPVCFRMIEDYMDNTNNLYMAGMNYASMVPEISRRRPIATHNTRIYSCILLNNEINKKVESGSWVWRGKYNEDTDLSLRVLKKGLPTILFNNMLANKMTTMSCKGGNTTSIYKDDGLQKKLDQLIEFHPDVAKKSNKFKKENHHHVDYTGFKSNKIIFKLNRMRYKKDYYQLKLFTDINKKIRKINKKQILTIEEPVQEVEELVEQPVEELVEEVQEVDNPLEDCQNLIKSKNLTEQQKKDLMIFILNL